mgnify:CR=1 FL=1
MIIMATPKFPDITMDDVRNKFKTQDETVIAAVSDAAKMGYTFVKHAEDIK